MAAKPFFHASALAGLLLLLQATPAHPADPLRVVASIPNLGSIASEIGGERIDLTVIAVGSQDAHFVDPKPSFMIKVRKADLLLVNGLDLEVGWIPPLTEGARNPRIIRGGPGYIDCSTGIRPIEIPATLSRAEGDVHPFGNPHYLTDPLNAEIVAATVADALSKADPGSASLYESRRQDFVRRLHEAVFGRELVELVGGSRLAREARAGTLDALLDGTAVEGSPLRSRLGGWMGRLASLPDRRVVTYHKDWSYFALRFGIEVVGLVEPKPGISPSPKHIEELTEKLGRGDARVIVSRPYLEHRSTDLLGQKTGASTVTLPLEVGGAPGTETFFQLFDHVVDGLARALGGAPAGAGR